ncbi:MAG: hypothetical protein ACJ78U_00945, partial [Myxococcales bacterium]
HHYLKLIDVIRGWLRGVPVEACPACGGAVRDHDVRLLARERFAPGTSAIEAHLERGEFARAAALDDRRVMGDQLVHHLVRCGDRTALVTSEDPVGLDLEPRVRRTVLLDGTAAAVAWRCAR